jgi:hypothetical protein
MKLNRIPDRLARQVIRVLGVRMPASVRRADRIRPRPRARNPPNRPTAASCSPDWAIFAELTTQADAGISETSTAKAEAAVAGGAALVCKPGDLIAWEIDPNGRVGLRRIQPADVEHLQAIQGTLNEWHTAEDEQADGRH